MKAMNPVTVRTLTVLSGGLTLTGGMVASPSGALLLFCGAFLSALFPTLLGRKVMRGVAALLLLVSAVLAFCEYPAFRQDQQTYRGQSGLKTIP